MTLASSGVPPQYLVEHWSTADGLPVAGVNRVLPGQSGYLWLATFDGLVRFDGHRFTVFRSGPAHPGLPSNRILQLIQTGDGQLWMLTEGERLVRFDGRGFHAIGRADGLSDPHVTGIQLDRFGTLWVSTLAGVLQRVPGDRFALIPGSKALGRVNQVLVTGQGQAWVAADVGLGEIVNGNLRHTFAAAQGVPVPAMAVARDAAGTLWVAGGRHVVRDAGNGTFRIAATVRGDIASMAAVGEHIVVNDLDNEYTIAVDGAIQRRQRDVRSQASGHVTIVRRAADGGIWHNRLRWLERDGREIFRSPCNVTDFEFGTDGAVWVATTCGLYELRPRHIFALSGLGGSAPVYSLAQAPDGDMWISTVSRGVAIRARDGSVTWLQRRARKWDVALRVVSIDSAGEAWVGSCRATVPGQCAIPDAWPPALGSDSRVHAIQRTSDGSLWVGGLGLWRQSPAGTWQDLSKQSGLVAGIRDDMVRVMIESTNATMWFGTFGAGVLRRDPTGHFRRFTRADGLASEAIRALRLDRRGQLWIATEDRGLCRMQDADSAKPRVKCIDSSRGMWSDSLHQVLFDEQGRMWLNSNSGIFAVSVAAVDAVLDDRAARVYPQVFTEKDGLPSREGNGGVDHAGIRLADGRMAFPTQAGVAIFDPRDLPPSTAQVRAVFEGLTLPDGHTLATAPQMTLARGIRSFTLHYTGLAPDLTAPVYFRYRVLPDSAWIDVGDAREVSLSHVSAGQRTIELVALGSDGKAGLPARITLDLPAYFYETSTFRIALPLLLLFALLAWMAHMRHAARHRQRELECTVAERTVDLRDALATVNSQRDEIARQAESKTRFFANVSHELRTPLALLVGPIEDYARGHAPAPELLAAMERNAHRLERLIGQLLDLERIDARRFPLHVRMLDLVALVQESVTAFEPLAAHEGVALEWCLPATEVLVNGDAEQLLRVLGNLLSNALKFCPIGGRVRVTLRAGNDGSANLRVDDSGPGVAPAWRTRIFDRFSQMASEATRHREGAGLGLALCREVAELHGGRLYAADSPLGGAGFVFELPAAEISPLQQVGEDPAKSVISTRADRGEVNVGASSAMPTWVPPVATAQAPRAAHELEADADARPLVLLAEDNRDLRLYLASILSEHYRVVAAVDGQAALALARTEPPDLVVSDLMMPKLDGLGLARAMRANDELAGVPIVFLTARGSDADRIKGLAGGADYYLTKPFDSRVLLAQLDAALRACQRLRERYAQRYAAASVPVVAAKTGFTAQLDALFEARAHDPAFGVAAIAAAVHQSESALRRRCRDACSTGPGELLRRHRLQRARTLLQAGAGNVSEIAYAVGYTSLSAFGRAYRSEYGRPPTQAQPS